MKATTEMEIKITGGRIIGAEVSADGVCRLTVEVESKKQKDVPSETLAETPKTPDKTPKTKPSCDSHKRICSNLEHDFGMWDAWDC